MSVFAVRNIKEILRDPINLAFGLGFPIVLLLLLTAIQANIPVEQFPLPRLTPGIAMFGLRDRSTSFLSRLFSAPLSAGDFILGYTLPLLPMSVCQAALCYLAAVLLGLEPSCNILAAILALLPAMVFFIAVGLLCGSIFNDKQVGGLCGALLTNLSAWLSGTWFDLEMVGGWFKKAADLLPFSHAVDAGRAALAGQWSDMLPHLLWTGGYAAVILAAAILVFRRKMSAD